MEPTHRERVQDQGVEEVLFATGTSFIQLLGALGPDTPVGRFLEVHGPGIHHLAYRVNDIEDALAHLRVVGLRLIDEHGRPGSRGTTIAFLHPTSMDGVLGGAGPGERRYGRSVRPSAGAFTKTLTLPSGSPPSPISWCT